MAGKAQFFLPGMGQQPSRSRPPRRSVDHGRANRREVHEATKPRHSGDRARIVALLEQRGPGGATRYELSVELQLPYTTVSARVTALKRMGCVVDTEVKRATPTGSPACVVVLVKSEQKGL
jgi:predicted transcriptional regulator